MNNISEFRANSKRELFKSVTNYYPEEIFGDDWEDYLEDFYNGDVKINSLRDNNLKK